MEINKIYNESNLETMKHLDEKSVDVVLTSPFYNTNHKAGTTRTIENTKSKKGHYAYVRYDKFVDNMSNDDYNKYTLELFEGFDKILKPNGVVLYNISYGADNADGLFDVLHEITSKTNFTIADCISWKKQSVLPNNVSPNKLSRICEFIFVFCKKQSFMTFHMNKTVVSKRKTGQKMYSTFFNFIEAKNNDGPCPFNKATFSTDLCKQLLNIYCPKGGLVYDPFMGSGTTAAACKEMRLNYLGSEISENQVKWANERLSKIKFDQLELF